MAMTLRLDADDEKALDELDEIDGVSEQEASRRHHQAQVSEAAWARKRYADVFERLGK